MNKSLSEITTGMYVESWTENACDSLLTHESQSIRINDSRATVWFFFFFERPHYANEYKCRRKVKEMRDLPWSWPTSSQWRKLLIVCLIGATSLIRTSTKVSTATSFTEIATVKSSSIKVWFWSSLGSLASGIETGSVKSTT